MFFKLTEDRRVRPTTGVVEQVLKRFQENIWNSKPGQTRRSNTVPECVYWLQRVAHLGCRLLACILSITQHGRSSYSFVIVWAYVCTLALHPCFVLLSDVVGLLELCESHGMIPSSYWLWLIARRNHIFTFASLNSDSFDMATSAPLLGAEKKGGHSKASIFYGADEYLEDVPYRAHWSFVNLNMFDEAAKLGHSPSSPSIVLGFEKLFVKGVCDCESRVFVARSWKYHSWILDEFAIILTSM